MNALLEQDNEESVLHTLDNMPAQLDDIYHEAMKRIERQPKTRELATRVLLWIAYSRRPLSVEELRHALAISPQMTEMNTRAFVFKSRLTPVCAGLVVIDKEQQIVRFARAWKLPLI
jgi:hypothetical protein